MESSQQSSPLTGSRENEATELLSPKSKPTPPVNPATTTTNTSPTPEPIVAEPTSAPPPSPSHQQTPTPVNNTQTTAPNNDKSTKTTTSKYVREFETLFVPIKVGELRGKAQNGGLRHCQFRSICWRYFLDCLPRDHEQWLHTCKDLRLKYDLIRSKHLNAIKPNQVSATASQDNIAPILSQSQHVATDRRSPSSGENEPTSHKPSDADDEKQFNKASNECDHKNVFRTIERDVVRTFPDMEFFKQTEMQTILENVLYNFANEYPHISYKQGMHELLATLLYVAHTDSQNCLINYEGDYANITIATLLDLKYLEHDVFHLFSALMRSLETWYQNDEILTGPEPTMNNRSSASRQVNSVLGLKLKKISENILKYHDLELFNHLEALQIAPQIYGIRWMRLLFGREFEFLDLLIVWDAIICDANPMSLMEYVFASMLITIREELVNGDYTDCLNNLMRYQYKDVPHVIRLALYLREPEHYERPRTGYQMSSRTHRAPHKQTDSSLTSKLSQQYISDRQYLQQHATSNRYHQPQLSSGSRATKQSLTQPQSDFDNRDQSRKIFSMNTQPMGQTKQRFAFNKSDSISNVASDGIRFLAQTSRTTAANALASSGSKLLPNINRFVSTIGQNLQDKNSYVPSSSSGPSRGNHQANRVQSQQLASPRSLSSSQIKAGYKQQQIPRDLILSAGNTIKEYEMREMQSSSLTPASSIGLTTSDARSRFPMSKPGSSSDASNKSAFNISTESYDDLHSIVDYCWRLLSEQIDSLQRCLPKEKGLSSEDEIFVALAQLKKVRDVLKGSLRLEDELESSANPAATGKY